jgi:hypothetical protein
MGALYLKKLKIKEKFLSILRAEHCERTSSLLLAHHKIMYLSSKLPLTGQSPVGLFFQALNMSYEQT